MITSGAFRPSPLIWNFDVQVEAAEELYGMQLKLSFSRKINY